MNLERNNRLLESVHEVVVIDLRGEGVHARFEMSLQGSFDYVEIHVVLKVAVEPAALSPLVELLKRPADTSLVIEPKQPRRVDCALHLDLLALAVVAVPLLEAPGILSIAVEAGQNVENHRLADRVVPDDDVDPSRHGNREWLPIDDEVEAVQLRRGGIEERGVSDLDARWVGNRHDKALERREALQGAEPDLVLPSAEVGGGERVGVPVVAVAPQDERDVRLRVPLNEVPHVDLVAPVADFHRVDELGEHDLVGALGP